MWDSDPADPARRTLIVGAGAWLISGCSTLPSGPSARLLYRDDFRNGLDNWVIEAERPGRISAADGILDIDVPAGVTLWFRHELVGPVAIEYEVMAVAEGGPNDEVSDINAFWMATDPRAPSGNVLEGRRSGAFEDYDGLRTYYAGIGGNRNTTSRFRRYVGRKGERPLLPEHDLSSREYLIERNRWYRIRLIADGDRSALLRDGKPMFQLNDPEPYTRGHFGLRTTRSHLRVRGLRIWSLR